MIGKKPGESSKWHLCGLFPAERLAHSLCFLDVQGGKNAVLFLPLKSSRESMPPRAR